MRELAGRYVILPVGGNPDSFNGMVQMNKTGGFLWECMESEQSKENLIEMLMNQYEVGREDAEKDVINFIEQLSQVGILEK